MTTTWRAFNGVSLSNGDLTALVSNLSYSSIATRGRSTGKWYWEVHVISPNTSMIGITNISTGGVIYNSPNHRGYFPDGKKWGGSTGSSYGDTFTTGNIISVLLDLDNGTIEFWKNGISQGIAFNDLLNLGEVFPSITSGSTNTSAQVTANFGNTAFVYSMPNGYKPYDNINRVLISLNDGKSLSVKKTYTENVIPTMTSQTEPIGNATSSSAYAEGNRAFKAFDNDLLTSWATNATTSGWIAYEFDTPKVIEKYAITADDIWFNRSPKSFTFEGSNDNLVWDILDTKNETGWKSYERREYVFKNNKAYKSYRLNVNSVDGGNMIQLNEIEMMESYLLTNELPTSTEQDFINYGMNTSFELDLSIQMSKKILISNTPTLLGSGKVYLKSINTKQLPIKNIQISYKSDVEYPLTKILISNDGYKKYDLTTSSWQTISITTPTESDYLNGNTIDEIASIPTEAWKLLSSNVELSLYTEDLDMEVVEFEISTNPFYLYNELVGKEPKIVYYTDDLTREDTLVTIGTESFLLFDEMGDSMEVLYYTDSSEKTTAKLQIDANYSPLDEILGEFEIVTYTNAKSSEYGELNINANITALPFGQLIINELDQNIYGDIKKIIVEETTFLPRGITRYLLSFDEGITWESCWYQNWRTVNIQSKSDIVTKGMLLNDISNIPETLLQEKAVNNSLRIAYYVEERPHRNESVGIERTKIKADSAFNTPIISDLAFYILNTTATIDLTFTGNRIVGKLDDADRGKVRYRVLVNGNPYYPANGEFTPFMQSPMSINLNISDSVILIDKENELKVEFEDGWGSTDAWVIKFIGTYSGLMFLDQTGKYYSTHLGQLLQYLDFGTVIAGQTTIEQKVVLRNQYGYNIKNIKLATVKASDVPEGVQVLMSPQASPFVGLEELTFNKTLAPDDELEFYVVISTNIDAKPTSNGRFEIKVTAEKVV